MSSGKDGDNRKSRRRAVWPKPSDSRADEAEVRAQRVASTAFLEAFGDALTDEMATALSGTEHEHHMLLRAGDRGLVVSMRIKFGDYLTAHDVQELALAIAAAMETPGGVVRS